MLVLKLGRFIAVPILSEWLVLKDLVLLDSGCCHSKYRGNLFKLYSALSFQNYLKSHLSIYIRSQSIQWFTNRELMGLQSVALAGKYLRCIETEQLCRFCRYATDIKIEYCSEESYCRKLNARAFSSLQSLNLCCIRGMLVNELILALSDRCDMLSSIVINECHELRADSLAMLCRKNPQLVRLEADIPLIDRFLPNSLLVHCRRLQYANFYVAEDKKRTHSMFLHHCSSTLVCLEHGFLSSELLVFYHCQHLKRINLQLSAFSVEVTLNRQCPQLQELTIVDIMMSYHTFNTLPVGLTSLVLSSYPLNDTLLKSIGTCCPSLTRLSCSRIEAEVDSFSRIPNLTDLQAYNGQANLLTSLSLHCPALRRLCFNGYIDNEQPLAEVFRNCTKLEDFTWQMDSSAVCDVLTHYATRLKSLKLICHMRQSNDKMKALFTKCIQLTSFSYKYAELKEDLLQLLVTYCVKLRFLDITGTDFKFAVLKKYVRFMPRVLAIKTSLDETSQAELDHMLAAVHE